MSGLFTLMRCLCLMLLLGLFHQAQARPVGLAEAELVGRYYFAQHTGLSLDQTRSLDLQLLHTRSSADLNGGAVYYIFNVGQDKGFVLVSGDDIAYPVLGYGDERGFPQNFAADMPEHFRKWLDGYTEQIVTAVVQGVQQDTETAALWDKYRRFAPQEPSMRSSVNPLMTTRWNQSPYYNALCPYDNSYGERSVVGCVATAAVQIMKYHAYPTQGTGFNSYSHSRYGTISANFGNTTYNWAAMPNTISSANTAVATISYHFGVAVNMNYGVGATGGSGAYVISSASPTTECAEHAFRTFFGYDGTSLQGLRRSSYTTTNWINLLKAELNASRPILYAGFGNGGGHAFVFDGYNTSNQFHVNWGWGGSYDGYFGVDALSPSGLGTGGGSGSYNSGQQALIGIRPPAGGGGGGGGGTTAAVMNINASVVVNPSPVPFNQAFTVTTNFSNSGTGNFSGDIAACLFDNSGNFLEFIETKTNRSLNAGNTYSNSQVFGNTNLKPTPGTYQVAFFTRATGSTSWVACGANGYTHPRSFTVQGSTSSYQLYSNITYSPTVLIENAPATFNYDIANMSSTAFSGSISIDLHSRDGAYLRTIDQKDNMTLCASCHYTGGLDFSTTALDAEPGTYLLTAWIQPTGGSWQLLGSTASYANPIEIVVQAAPLGGDIYENNNTAGAAFPFVLGFVGNSATRVTTGSNTHIGTDVDHYSVTLPLGFDYVLNPRLHDSYNSANGNTYTNDVLFSYSSDGGANFSETYDHVMPNALYLAGGTTVIFKVASYFQGTTGTYVLDIPVTRNIASSVETLLEQAPAYKLFPNPADASATLSWGEVQAPKSVQLYDAAGRLLWQQTAATSAQNTLIVPTSELPAAAYILRIEQADGSIQSLPLRVQR